MVKLPCDEKKHRFLLITEGPIPESFYFSKLGMSINSYF